MKPKTVSRLIDCLVLVVGSATILFMAWVYGNVQFDKGFQAAVTDRQLGRVTQEYRVHP